MARIKEIVFSMGYTMQPRQYESIRADATVTVEVVEGETDRDAAEYAQGFVRAQIIAALLPSVTLLPEARQRALLHQLGVAPIEITSIEEVSD